MVIKEVISKINKVDSVKKVVKTIKANKLISIVVLIISIIVINSSLWTTIDGLVTTGTLLAVILNIYINEKNNESQLQKVPIYFNDKKLNLDITRKDFSRQELQGILGILRKNMKEPYDVAFLSKIDYLNAIYKIQKLESDKLHIDITDNELEQFKDDIYETNI